MKKTERKRIQKILQPHIDICEDFIDYMLTFSSTDMLLKNETIKIDSGKWKSWHDDTAKLGIWLCDMAFKFNLCLNSDDMKTFGDGRISNKNKILTTRIYPSAADSDLIYETYLLIIEALKYSKQRRSTCGYYMQPFDSVTLCLRAQVINEKLYELII